MRRARSRVAYMTEPVVFRGRVFAKLFSGSVSLFLTQTRLKSSLQNDEYRRRWLHSRYEKLADRLALPGHREQAIAMGTHRSRLVREFVAAQRGHLTLEYLPA